jgi:nitrite reductase/ring-hydroxylating ferredoxin subunit
VDAVKQRVAGMSEILQVTIMADFVEVARVEKIPPGSGSRFTVADKDVAVFNVDGTICVIADTCPHAGGSLGLGKLDGRIVTCPVHGMKFDVTTGCFAGTSDYGVASYPAKVVDGEIMVALRSNEKTN